MPPNSEYWKAHSELKGEVGEIKGEVKGLNEKVSGLQTDQKAGFESISGRMDTLIKANGGNPSKRKEEKKMSLLGFEVPRKNALYFLLGAMAVIYILMSQFPGLMHFMEMVNGGAEKVLQCEKGEDGKMNCEGSIEELADLINGDK